MLVIKESTWSKLPFTDYRPRFFIEIWRAYLHRNTPHFYQTRLMNWHSSLIEVNEVIDDYFQETKNVTQLRHSCSETLDILATDTSFNKVFSPHHELLGVLLKRVAENKNSPEQLEADLRKLKKLIALSISHSPQYLSKILEELHHTITSSLEPENIKPSIKTLDLIYQLTGQALSFLLSQGFSPTYLYNRAELLTFPNRYKGKLFETQLSVLFDRLQRSKTIYTSIRAFSYSRTASIDTLKVGKVEFAEDINDVLTEEDKKAFGHDNIDGYLITKLESPDYIAAAWEMQRHIETIRDIFSFEYKTEVLNLSPVCQVISNENGHAYKHQIKIELLQTLLIKRPHLYQDNMAAEISKILDGNKCTQETKDSIKRMLRYYRLGVTETTMESKFLSAWIALEALIGNEDGNVIEKITNFVPPLYAYDSLAKRLNYLLSLLRARHVTIPSKLISITNWDETNPNIFSQLAPLYEIVSSEEHSNVLYESLGNDEYLKYRLWQVHQDFKDKKSIIRRVGKTKMDVVQQLRRIYYVRNKIVHRGDHGTLDLRLFTHLCDYIGCILTEVVITLASDSNANSIRDVLEGYLLSIDQKTLVWRNERVIKLPSNEVLFLSPIL